MADLPAAPAHQERASLARAALRLADRIPRTLAEWLAEDLARASWPVGCAALVQSMPHPEFRGAVAEFLASWQSEAGSLPPAEAATAIRTAALAEQVHQERHALEMVWTGPEHPGARFRQTEQALLEVLGAARKRLTIVSYAVYKIPRIREALIDAARRGVDLRIITETPSRIEGQGEYDCLRSLGPRVSRVARVYYWPEENRPRDEGGRTGILHVKCAVADGQTIFLSSANLTDYAFTINMELGILVTGGPLPRQVDEHFTGLIQSRVLLPV